MTEVGRSSEGEIILIVDGKPIAFSEAEAVKLAQAIMQCTEKKKEIHFEWTGGAR